MKTTKKLLLAFFAAVLSFMILSGTAFATETDIQVQEDSEELFFDYAEEDIDLYDVEPIYFIDFDEDEPVDTGVADKKEKEAKAETTAKKPTYSEKDLRLLSSLVYSEAGNQSYKGMLAVANVVLNRVKSPAYSHVKTIEEVIYDRKWAVQFAVTVKSKKTGLSMLDKALNYYDTRKFSGPNPEAEKKAMDRAIKAAKAALEGENNIGDYLCFQNKRRATTIKKKYPVHLIIGDHIFYRTK